ncbi:PREDICTED: fat-body protein 1-like [Bactrocera latifrons]|uniref:Arylphorin subunit C223 n=2 Tax=Bactrocera latifrons TaxID=174628 RepID=A0A0K8U2D1_BACLA|nr:PREDICTED: fat-body protein 1-like [Bactrocera latifrons]
MKIFIFTLIGLISFGAAAVIEDVDIQKGGPPVGIIGTRHISQMSHEDLLRQKFLLDILQHVQEPNVNEEELLQMSKLQPEHLVDDHTHYTGGIDDEMALVIELSRNQRLLAKDKMYTIADVDDIRQMIGLYRVFVRSRDWDTLQRNLLYAHAHVNGVLLVNSLLLAVRDRNDTQNLVMPGIHEILPELYLDAGILRRAKEINFNQLSSSSTSSRQTQRPRILEMIRLNKLWNRNTNPVNTLDREQLWMPWREMRMEVQGRKVGAANNDDRIVLPVTLSSDVLRKERGVRLFTNDVGFQSFLHSLINDLCLSERESELQNEQQMRVDTNRPVLRRVGLERNVGSMLESEIRRKEEQIRGQNMIGIHTVDLNPDKDRFIYSGRHLWSGLNRNTLSNDYPSDRYTNSESGKNVHRVEIGNDDSSNLPWKHRDNSIYLRNPFNDYFKDTPQVGSDNNQAGVPLPTTTADDERLLHVNHNRQQAAVNNRMYFRDEQPKTAIDLNGRWGQTGVNQINNHISIQGEHFDPNDVANSEHRGLEQRIDLGVNMPMDWNRQTAMHRQKKTHVVDNSVVDSSSPLNIGHTNDYIQTNNQVQDVDIINKGQEHVGSRGLNQWEKENQRQDSIMEERRNVDRNQEGWKNVYARIGRSWMNFIHSNKDDAISEERIVEDPRILTTVARGMGNIGIHSEQVVHRQNDINPGAQLRINISRRRLNNDPIHITSQHDRNVHDIEVEGSGMGRYRSPRSLLVVNRDRYWNQKRDGELILHNLQQLMARINLEHISLGIQDILQIQDDAIAADSFTNQRLSNSPDQRLALRLNRIRLNSRRSRILLNRIRDVESRLHAIIEQQILRGVENEERNDIRSAVAIDQLIGDILLGKRSIGQGVNLLNILSEIILQTEDINANFQTLNQISMDTENPILLHLLRRIVQIADLQRQQQLGSYSKEDLQMDGVSINNVSVDKLQTYVDTNDVDLINAAISANQLRGLSQRMVVARQQRLNHQAFTINVDVTANHNKRVVVRTLLGPKIDTFISGTQLNRQRQNFILLDTFIADLHSGRNVITRKSNDITWTARDTTPFTEIYKTVMQALEGDADITMDAVQGQSCRFPHRLLLPRGRVEGLPMQMLVIITPVTTDWQHTVHQLDMVHDVCGMGMSSTSLDHLPLGFPLDRPIESMENIGSLPNAHLMDVQIFHSKQLVADDFY